MKEIAAGLAAPDGIVEPVDVRDILKKATAFFAREGSR
jgi:hypothetical protein